MEETPIPSARVSQLVSLPTEFKYNTDQSYRQCIRMAFQMDSTRITPYADLELDQIQGVDELDDESKDEMQYDTANMDKGLNDIYDWTKGEKAFQELYKCAAAQFLSEDPLVGQVVCCSYDYFSLYVACLRAFYYYGSSQLVKSEAYVRLLSAIK